MQRVVCIDLDLADRAQPTPTSSNETISSPMLTLVQSMMMLMESVMVVTRQVICQNDATEDVNEGA